MTTTVSSAAFRDALDPLLPSDVQALAVACSGGPDSMALVFLAHQWSQGRGVVLRPVIVDHGLRDAAPSEALWTAERLREMGLSPTVLTHRGPRPKSNVMAAARAIRYGLIEDWMRGEGLTYLAVGHHQDDQAETFLQRLSRGSGVDGLAAMAPKSVLDSGLTLVRPLLGFPKVALESALASAGADYLIDPTNSDIKHGRTRVRNAAAILAAEGFTPARLAATAARMARAQAALDQARDAFLRDHAAGYSAGYAHFNRAAFADLPEEIGLRVLGRLCRSIGGSLHPAREQKLVAAHRVIVSADLAGGRTLAGCRIVPMSSNSILVARETAQIDPPIPLKDQAVWDNRFLCRTLHDKKALQIGKLGFSGIRQARSGPYADALSTLPGVVRPTIPGLWDGGRLLGIPALQTEGMPELGVSLVFRDQGMPWAEASVRE